VRYFRPGQVLKAEDLNEICRLVGESIAGADGILISRGPGRLSIGLNRKDRGLLPYPSAADIGAAKFIATDGPQVFGGLGDTDWHELDSTLTSAKCLVARVNVGTDTGCILYIADDTDKTYPIQILTNGGGLSWWYLSIPCIAGKFYYKFGAVSYGTLFFEFDGYWT
jgi:hypothetical protein